MSRVPVTQEAVERLRALIASGLTVVQAAEEMGVTPRHAYWIAKSKGVKTPMAGRCLGRRPRPHSAPSPGGHEQTERAFAMADELREVIDEVLRELSPKDAQNAMMAALTALMDVVEPSASLVGPLGEATGIGVLDALETHQDALGSVPEALTIQPSHLTSETSGAVPPRGSK